MGLQATRWQFVGMADVCRRNAIAAESGRMPPLNAERQLPLVSGQRKLGHLLPPVRLIIVIG
jgi:hypothetical protein